VRPGASKAALRVSIAEILAPIQAAKTARAHCITKYVTNLQKSWHCGSGHVIKPIGQQNWEHVVQGHVSVLERMCISGH
jgi:hypothetical protein